MKLPKTVTIYGKTWKVIKNPKSNGGCFSLGELEVGTREKQRILDVFLHETIEAILTENFFRYGAPHTPAQNGDYIFVFNHKEFENLIPQIALAIRPMIEGQK